MRVIQMSVMVLLVIGWWCPRCRMDADWVAYRRNRWQGAAKDSFLCLMRLNYWMVRHVWIC